MPRTTPTRSTWSSTAPPSASPGSRRAVSLTLDHLVHRGVITVRRMVELLSVNPAQILRVPGGSLSEGVPADITILAPDLAVTVDVSAMKSRSKNTPFGGWALRGGIVGTIVGGTLVYANPLAPGADALAAGFGR